MKLSSYLLPTLKNNPKDAVVVSHQLMLRAGMIRMSGAGIYTWLPLGLKVLQKVENIIREEMNAGGTIECLMPCVQIADLWKESGRYDAYGKEMLRITDRHERELLFGPTAEEVITDIVRNAVTSYKHLPLSLYQIQWKFRDEIRPRFGVMRGREFYMKDSYSFDISEQDMEKSYIQHLNIYRKIFRRLSLNAIPIRANSGEIGGKLSHEFHVIAKSGESDIYYSSSLLNMLKQEKDISIDDLDKHLAYSDEEYDKIQDNLGEEKNSLICSKAIEVGHIFAFDQKYTIPMNCKVNSSEGQDIPLYMGSYGIGVSRLVAAIIEVYSDDKGIIWPNEVAPFDIILINGTPKDQNKTDIANDLYHILSRKYDVLHDDTNNSMGQKLANANLIGIPHQFIISGRQESIEYRNRTTLESQILELNEIQNFCENGLK